jgi:hypothetical protein
MLYADPHCAFATRNRAVHLSNRQIHARDQEGIRVITTPGTEMFDIPRLHRAVFLPGAIAPGSNGATVESPRRAASMVAMSIFFIVIIRLEGTLCFTATSRKRLS